METSKSRYRKDLLFLDTTDRVPVCTEVVVAHFAIKVEVIGSEEVVYGVVVRSGRPVFACFVSTAALAVVEAEEAGSREEYLRYTCCI